MRESLNRVKLLLIFVGLSMALSASANATIVLELDKQQLTTRATVIVHGKVLSKITEFNQSKTRIYTVYTIKPTTWFKRPGKTPTEFRVSVLGGEIGKIGMRTPGTTQMTVGEEVVLFIERKPKRNLVVGMAQGKFSIYSDKKSKRKMIRSKRAGLTLARRPVGKKTLQFKPAQATNGQKFDDFVIEIRGYLKRKTK